MFSAWISNPSSHLTTTTYPMNYAPDGYASPTGCGHLAFTDAIMCNLLLPKEVTGCFDQAAVKSWNALRIQVALDLISVESSIISYTVHCHESERSAQIGLFSLSGHVSGLLGPEALAWAALFGAK